MRFQGAIAILFAVAAISVGFSDNASAQSSITQAYASNSTSSEKPYIVEWVYRIKWGHEDEFFEIFKKYQVPILNQEKKLGYVTEYTIFKPGLHASQDSRWDYRVIIVYKNESATGHAEEISKQLFPEQTELKAEERRRWEITEVHWDLPIRVVDPESE